MARDSAFLDLRDGFYKHSIGIGRRLGILDTSIGLAVENCIDAYIAAR